MVSQALSSSDSSPRAGLSGWRLASIAPVLTAALTVAAICAFAPQLFNDGDTYWHLATGRWILDHHAVPTTDPFSYTAPGRRWITHEWVSEVAMALAWRAGGWAGLHLLFALAAGTAAALMGVELRRWLPPLSTAVVLALAFACMSGSLLARPHLLALPMLVFWASAMLRARRDGRTPPFWLVAVMAVWANLHASFIIGLALSAMFGLEAVFESGRLDFAAVRRWGLFGFACAIATLATPNGVEGVLYPFQVMNLKFLPHLVEWRSADFSHWSAFEISILAFLFVALSRGVVVPMVRLIGLLALLHLGLNQVRQEIVLAAVAPLLLAAPLGAVLQPRAGEALGFSRRDGRNLGLATVAGLVLIGIVRLAIPSPRADSPTSPGAALAHVPANLRSQPVLNGYGMGGFLIFNGVRPFIDGRSDMYGDAFAEAYFAATAPDAERLKTLLAQHRVMWTLLDAADPSNAVLDAAGWRVVYRDRFAVVHALSPAGS